MHLSVSLPTSIENGARQFYQWDKEVVRTDGGHEVRNTRWDAPLRYFEISFPNRKLDDVDHAAVAQMWLDTEGGTHTFDFYDERASETIKVRFDGDLQFSHTVGPFHRIEAFTLREVLD